MEIVRKPHGQRFDHFECCLRAANLGHRDRSVERHDRRWLHDLEGSIEQINLRPIGVFGPGGAGMQRGDCRLDLIRPAAAVAHGFVDQRQTLSDHLLVPQRAILIIEQHQRAVGIEARRGSRVLQQQQRSQPHDLGLALEQPQQQPRQAYSLLAKGTADFGGVAGCGIALIENQIDHRGHRGEPFRALRRARRLERHVGIRHPGFRPRDPLLYRRFRNQERTRCLLYAQPRNNS